MSKRLWYLWSWDGDPNDINNYPKGTKRTATGANIGVPDDSGRKRNSVIQFYGTLEDIFDQGFQIQTASNKINYHFAYVSKIGF